LQTIYFTNMTQSGQSWLKLGTIQTTDTSLKTQRVGRKRAKNSHCIGWTKPSRLPTVAVDTSERRCKKRWMKRQAWWDSITEAVTAQFWDSAEKAKQDKGDEPSQNLSPT